MKDDSDDEEKQQNFYVENRFMKTIGLCESVKILADRKTEVQIGLAKSELPYKE